MKEESMIVDGFSRVHDYLRISLTDNCNLRCFYCMPDEGHSFMPTESHMQAEEIEQIAKIFVGMGVKKIRLTGGEPLVRKDAADIIMRLSRLPVHLTLTTNATRIAAFKETIKAAGMKTVNVSLDTLQPERFRLMTKRDQFETVFSNIEYLMDMGMHVKVNAVIVKGLNDNEVIDFVKWTEKQPVHVRFIEFMPFRGNRWDRDRLVTWQEILDTVSQKFQIYPMENHKHATARKYGIQGHKGSFAVISTMSAPFCSDCNRMRLTADGKMKNCLFSSDETDLLGPFRNHADIKPLILQSIRNKKQALGGQFGPEVSSEDAAAIDNRSMIAIGG